jgi:glycerophosphoryl diester phosphodiesterase
MKLALSFLPAVLACSAIEAGPIVIAHRGASGYLPEHTLESKALAHAMGADFLEQDIVLTKDDVPIVMHDIQLETISDVAKVFGGRKRADGHYYALDFTFAEIKQLQAHERTNPKTGQAVYPGRFPLGQSTFQIPSLEEELQFIQGLNKSTGRTAGIYPEIKQPAWHRREGHDISKIVLPILVKYGYATTADPCWLQCFEFEEVKRIRRELGWKGHLVQLTGGGSKSKDGSETNPLLSPEGISKIAEVADGIGPSLNAIASGKSKSDRKLTDLVKRAHAAHLAVHPYTLRADELPKFAESMDDALDLLFNQAGIDGLFSDFPDTVVHWLQKNAKR